MRPVGCIVYSTPFPLSSQPSLRIAESSLLVIFTISRKYFAVSFARFGRLRNASRIAHRALSFFECFESAVGARICPHILQLFRQSLQLSLQSPDHKPSSRHTCLHHTHDCRCRQSQRAFWQRGRWLQHIGRSGLRQTTDCLCTDEAAAVCSASCCWS